MDDATMSDPDGTDRRSVLSSLRSQLELVGFDVDRIEYDEGSRAIVVRYVLTADATASVTDVAIASRIIDEHVPQLAQVFDNAVDDAADPDRYRRLVVLALDPPKTSASDERLALRLEIESELAREWNRSETTERREPLYRRVADTARLIGPDGKSSTDVEFELDID